MTMHLRRCTSLLLCTCSSCAALSSWRAVGMASSAGALQPRLTTTASSLSFGEATLGTYVGPQDLHHDEHRPAPTSRVTFAFSGPAANDWAWSFGSNCPNPSDASGEVITLAAGQACTVDVYFYPGALGARDATLSLTDPADTRGLRRALGHRGDRLLPGSSTGTVAYAGDAAYYGDASDVHLNNPIVGMAQTGDNGGYWLVASDGGIFNYGDAPFFGSTGGIVLNKPIVGMAGDFNANGPNGLLAGGVRRRHLQLRRRAVLRLDGQHPPQQADRGHGRDTRRQRLLAGGFRRRHLRLRRCAVLRLDRQHPPQQADRGHGPDTRRRRVLAGGLRRRHLRLRRCAVLRLDRQHPPGPAHRRHGRPCPTAGATGSPPPTAGSSTTGPPRSSAAAAGQGLGTVVGMATDGVPT